MITFNVKDEVMVNLPTKVEDITVDYLRDVSNEIIVAPDYALIGLIQGTGIAELLFANQKKKGGLTTTVLPIFIKAGETNVELIKNVNIKDTIVISRSNIEMGEHVRLSNNILTIPTLIKYIEQDDNLRHSIIDRSFFVNRHISANTMAYAVEFKIVPVNDIHGVYTTRDADYHNPFVNKIK